MSTQKYQELLAKLENANLHRESNITLRTQLELSQKRYEELESEMNILTSQVEPLKSKY